MKTNEKENIAKLLKDCPQGMELDCALFDEPIMFDCIIPETTLVNRICYRICAKVKGGGYVYFTEKGTLLTADAETKCVIFPKGKTTWEGFHRPFKEGDIVASDSGLWLGIIKYKCDNSDAYEVHCVWYSESEMEMDFCTKGDFLFSRLATEAEKAKLFQIIKDNGYKWDDKFKTLVKFVKPKFNVGDIIQNEDLYRVKITEVNIDDECYGYESILYKVIGGIAFNEQDEWSLLSDKFDINTLVPFKSKVLVKPEINSFWMPSFFGFYNKDASLPFICCNGFAYKYCIPYEDNEHLLGTTTDCNEYFKTWKE